MPFELRPEPHPTLRPEGDYLQRAWQQSVYPIARKMGVPIKLPSVSPQPHTHLAFDGYQYAKEHGRGNDYNHRVLTAFFVEGLDIGKKRTIQNTLVRMGMQASPAQDVTALAEFGIDVTDAPLRQVKVEMLKQAARVQRQQLKVPNAVRSQVRRPPKVPPRRRFRS